MTLRCIRRMDCGRQYPNVIWKTLEPMSAILNFLRWWVHSINRLLIDVRFLPCDHHIISFHLVTTEPNFFSPFLQPWGTQLFNPILLRSESHWCLLSHRFLCLCFYSHIWQRTTLLSLFGFISVLHSKASLVSPPLFCLFGIYVLFGFSFCIILVSLL